MTVPAERALTRILERREREAAPITPAIVTGRAADGTTLLRRLDGSCVQRGDFAPGAGPGSIIDVPAGSVHVTRGLARAAEHLSAGLGAGNLTSSAGAFLFVESVEGAVYEPGQSYAVVVTGAGFTAATVLVFLLAVDPLAPALDANPDVVITGQVLVDPTRIDLTLDVGAGAVPALGLPLGYAAAAADPLRVKQGVYDVALPPAGEITLVATVVNDDGGTLGVDDFPLFVDAEPMSSGVPKAFVAGTYLASSTPQAGYASSPWSGDAAPDGTIILAAGQVAAAAIVHDDVGVPTELPLYVLRPRNGLLADTLYDLFAGTLILDDPSLGEAGSFTVDYGTVIATVDWGTPAPHATDGPKLWLLPDGGPGVGKNSVAMTIRRRSGDLSNSGGESIFRVWDGEAGTVTSWATGVSGWRIEQPVLDGDLWWFVEFQVPAGLARLRTMPLDLSEAPTTVHTMVFQTTLNSLYKMWLTPTLAYCPEIAGLPNHPDRCWEFRRDGSGGEPTLLTYVTSLFDDQRATASQSGWPYGSSSWCLALGTSQVGWAEHLDVVGSTVSEASTWGAPPLGDDFVYGGRAVSSEIPELSEVMISNVQVPAGAFVGKHVIHIGARSGAGMRRFLTEQDPPAGIGFAWVRRYP